MECHWISAAELPTRRSCTRRISPIFPAFLNSTFIPLTSMEFRRPLSKFGSKIPFVGGVVEVLRKQNIAFGSDRRRAGISTGFETALRPSLQDSRWDCLADLPTVFTRR